MLITLPATYYYYYPLSEGLNVATSLSINDNKYLYHHNYYIKKEFLTNENRNCARKQTEYFDSTHLSTITLIIDIHDDRFDIKI